MYVCMYVCMYTCMHVCKYVSIHVSACKCMCAFLYTLSTIEKTMGNRVCTGIIFSSITYKARGTNSNRTYGNDKIER